LFSRPSPYCLPSIFSPLSLTSLAGSAMKSSDAVALAALTAPRSIIATKFGSFAAARLAGLHVLIVCATIINLKMVERCLCPADPQRLGNLASARDSDTI